MEEYFPIERPGQKKDFSSSYAKLKKDDGKRGKKDNEPKSSLQMIRVRDKSRYMQGLNEIKGKRSKNYQAFSKLNKLIEKNE